MNQVDARRWKESLEAAREASSPVVEDFGYLEPATGRASAPGRAGPLRLLATWRERARLRAELAKISARDLEDAGLSPEAVEFEAAQPFWRPLGVERK